LTFTAYEPPFNIILLGCILDDLDRTLRMGGQSIPENVAIGTGYFGEINAFASAPVRGSTFQAILLDDGLFVFINSLAKIVSSLLAKRSEGSGIFSFSGEKASILEALEVRSDLNYQFVDLIATYFITGHARFSERFSILQEDNLLADILRSTAETFIVAHEYGHILHRHLDGSNVREKSIAKEMKVDTWVINWAKEFQADEFAMLQVIRLNHHLKDLEAEISYIGIPFFFTSIEILYRIIGQEFSETHPSPDQRIQHLEQCLYNDSPDKDLVNDMVRAGQVISFLIHNLYEHNKDAIAARFKSEIRDVAPS
jgi:hypothetical protein